MSKLERIEGGRGYTPDFITTVGEKLGWMDGATMNTKKIGNTELMGITAFDDEFVSQHNRMAELLEAYSKFGGKYIKHDLDTAKIYEGVEKNEPLNVKVIDHSDPTTEIDEAKVVREMDIREVARLLRMRQLNTYLGEFGFTEPKLDQMFFAGEPLKVVLSNGQEVDYYQFCPTDDMADFDFKGYLKKIRENQMGLQWMGSLKDEALGKKHIENACHALFLKTNRLDALTGFEEYLWVPVCETMAANFARGDLQKIDTGTKASGHVHEFAHYNEDTGASVKVEFDLIQKHRAGIDYRSFQKTLARTYKAAVGLTQNEFAKVYDEEVQINAGEKKRLKIFDVGAGGKGDIFTGMHKTYDKSAELIRGFKFTDDEAADKILTDVIGPWITNNTSDWLMCMAQSINGKIAYDVLKSASKGGGDWAKNFGFCVRIRCKNDSGVVEPRDFKSVNELIDYVNRRIRKGEITGVASETSIPGFEGMTKDQLAKADEDMAGMLEQDIENEFLRKVSTNQLKSHSHLFRKIFGDHSEKVAENFMDKGLETVVKDGENSYDMIDYVDVKLRGMSFKNPEDYMDLVEPSQELLNEDEARKHISAFLRSLAEITPEERASVESSNLDSAKKQETLENLTKQKNKYRKLFHQMVKETGKQQADRAGGKKKK